MLPLLAALNSAAVNVGMCLHLSTVFSSSVFPSRSGITGMFDLLRDHETPPFIFTHLVSLMPPKASEERILSPHLAAKKLRLGEVPHHPAFNNHRIAPICLVTIGCQTLAKEGLRIGPP